MEIKEEQGFMANKTVLIVGANSRLGKHIVDLFIEANWIVFGTYSQKSKFPLSQVENFTPISMNLEKSKSINKGIKTTLKRSKSKLDLLINTSGVVYSGPIEAFSEEELRKQMEINFFAAVAIIQNVIPPMKKSGNGTIVNVSSLCGLTSFPLLSMYHASKWALEGFTESIYYELSSLGIKVKLIEPGGIVSDGEYAKVIKPKNTVEGYEKLTDKVHGTSWFPSFTEAKDVAYEIFKIATEETDQLRHQIGTETVAFIEERERYRKDETHLKMVKNRLNI